ncbi:hypothetical protein D0B54_07450 [Solimonas sp. K1W22B-7]|nr:hypothetical protein D0B54_07450 [Solimonas sp. K1W22B-7]
MGTDDHIRRGDRIQTTSNDFNYTVARAEAELSLRFGEHVRFITRARGVFDPSIYEEFDQRNLDRPRQGGVDSGPWADPGIYEGRPDYFSYKVADGKGGFVQANPLEWAGRDYLVYLPAAIVELTAGDLNLRLGNQQIAWGQSLFFQVFDMPNGLDLRRHSILDRALEEFSDKRVPMLSARLSYQLTDGILFDGYVGKFQPTVLGNPNTPYNIIPTQFTVQDQYVIGGYDEKVVGGFRLKGDYGQWGFQAAYFNRYNPLGVFRWTATGVDRQLDGRINSVGSLVNLLYSLKLPGCSEAAYDPLLCRRYADTGDALANAPFHAGDGGVYSADEWFHYAAEVRLDGVGGLNAAINEFPGAQDVYATPVDNVRQAAAELNTFFIAAGGSLRGHIAREYFQEDIFALGASYVLESDNDFLNQLIFNLEAQYTPERTFTNPTLSRNYIRQDEYMVSLVVDKWHRFFKEFPGTYIVFQALTKNRSDLVGRHLSGYGGKDLDELDPRATSGVTGKKGNANYVVLGFTQPWPNKLYELEFASLWDIDGGVFMQPGLRWNPGHGVTVEGFYNYIDGSLFGADRSKNLISTLDFAEEFTLRLTYQF